MHSVEISHISKSFGPVKAVNDVSLTVDRGEFFGLLGPNGAGKTTTIRILLDIFKPDRGTVSILDGPMTEEKKNRIGYMPEERGLYQDIQLERCLVYLASLKGLGKAEIRKRLAEYFDKFDLAAHKHKKVKELSKGMQQKAQIIMTILHKPDLLVIDEPFSGLDPVNTQMVKDMFRELHAQGTTIIMSTHQMHQVEELCQRLMLIDHGESVLYGKLDEIQKEFSGHAVLVRTHQELPELKGVEKIERSNSTYKLSLSLDITPQEILQSLVQHGITIDRFEIALPDLDEIFIRVVTQKQTRHE